jgi:hypothetical protein
MGAESAASHGDRCAFRSPRGSALHAIIESLVISRNHGRSQTRRPQKHETKAGEKAREERRAADKTVDDKTCTPERPAAGQRSGPESVSRPVEGSLPIWPYDAVISITGGLETSSSPEMLPSEAEEHSAQFAQRPDEGPPAGLSRRSAPIR